MKRVLTTIERQVTGMKLKPLGDRVIFFKYAGTEIKVEEEEYTIVSQKDIVAIVE